MTRRKKKPRTFTHAHRQRLDRAAEHYLRSCYTSSTAARASEFARQLGMTPEYASWLGEKILGKSLHAYLREKQVAYATRLLQTSPLTVNEIAVRAGFGTPATLYRWFVEVHGMPPGAFRGLKK